jgi:cysteine desulfurase/selenocysteine lyase
MTLNDILTDEKLRQHEFPVTRDKIFLSHAAVCPLPRRVTETIQTYLQSAQCGDQETVLPPGWMRRLRELTARLIRAHPDEIALVGPTSLALSFVASGFSWRAKDNIVVYQDDYPSNVYPWMALAEKQVEVRFLKAPELGRIRLENVQAKVDERTRLVALASCHFISGFRLDLPGIGRFLQERGIPFCVDGIQTLGAFPSTVEHVDFLAADAHKWLLGPCAAGILFIRQNRQESLLPSVFGWHNVRCPDYVAQDSLTFLSDARRYEAGTANVLGLIGLLASLELLLEIGLDRIAAELLRKRAWLVPALQAKGYTVLEADAPPAHASGIISFFGEKSDLAALHQKLSANHVVTSLRTDRRGQQYLRLSPHFYNTDEELHRMLKIL